MLEKVQAFPSQTLASDLELHSLTAGQIADLCRLQQRIYQHTQQEKRKRQQKEKDTVRSKIMDYQETSAAIGRRRDDDDDDDNENDEEVEEYTPLPPYTPINPFAMNLSGTILLERSEPGRLDVRLNSLREELKAFGYKETRR
jgi:hypothetical protein